MHSNLQVSGVICCLLRLLYTFAVHNVAKCAMDLKYGVFKLEKC